MKRSKYISDESYKKLPVYGNEAKPRNIILNILLIKDNVQYDWGVMK
jgi:hypothetical protein